MQVPQGFRRHYLQLQARGFFNQRQIANWQSLSSSDQDAAVFAAAIAARSRDPHNRIWKVVPKLGRDTPYQPEPLPKIDKRHSIYHVYASRKNDHWRANVSRLIQHADRFDGARIAAIACDDSTHPFEVAAAPLREAGWQCLKMPNDNELREVLTFLPLLCAVRPFVGANDAVFYAHTKGNTTRDGESGAAIWREAMYRTLLESRYAEALESLRSVTFAGCCKIRWSDFDRSPFPSGLNVGRWMLAGTFYWFRGTVFDSPRWRQVIADRYGAEAWPSVVCPNQTEGKSLYQPWPEEQYPTPNPYNPATYLEYENAEVLR